MSGTVKVVRRGALMVSAVLAAFIAQQALHAQSAPAKVSNEEAEGIIFERQQIMLQIEKDSQVLGEIAAGLQKPDKLAEAARSIAQGAKESLAAFEPNVPGGRAKPEVWSNWADYKQRLEAFAKNSENMARIAESGNVTGVVEVMAAALPCKECHDVYRTPKKKPAA